MQSPTGVVLRRSISVCRAPRTQLQMHRVMTRCICAYTYHMQGMYTHMSAHCSQARHGTPPVTTRQS